ncbi:MAG TPA: hypothetical protein VFT59_03825 [Candidatus Saccharimonadales bacterium]|nr:hypothetical protein [Candidatus Saccharimonadales bacterium]
MERPLNVKPEVFGAQTPIGSTERYARFVEHTDEKSVIAEGIRPYFLPGTILDIGAGRGEIPTLLGVDTQSYTAIEQNPNHAEVLSANGYKVIEEHFPCACPAPKYDNILLSHSLFTREQYTVMIEAASQLTTVGGRLIIVTYRDTPSDYSTLINSIGETRPENDERHDDLLNVLQGIGATEVRRMQSHIYSEDVDDLIDHLSFMATNNSYCTAEKREMLSRKLKNVEHQFARYFDPALGVFAFPIDHYLYVTEKES